MAAPSGDTETEPEEGRGSQLMSPRPSADLSLDQSIEYQVLGLSSFLPSPPSEPPDIRYWFSSYEYDSPGSSDLPFELGSHVGDPELTARFEKIEELPPKEHALYTGKRSNCQSQKRQEWNQLPGFERLPVSKAKDEHFFHFKDEDLFRQRIEYCQNKQGGSSPNSGSIVTDGDLRAPNGPYELCIYEHVDGDRESGLPQIMESQIKHDEQSRTTIQVNNQREHDESLGGRCSGSSGHLLLESSQSEIACKNSSRKELLQGDIRREERNPVADGLMNSREDSGDPGGSWISTRDNKCHSPGENLQNGNRKHCHVRKHVPITTRTPLVDKTNHLDEPSGATRAPEIHGKWQCPRKNKAERGPPLKQLRLECWVRRVI